MRKTFNMMGCLFCASGRSVSYVPFFGHCLVAIFLSLSAGPACAVSSTSLEAEAAKKAESGRAVAAPVYLKAALQRVAEAKTLFAKAGTDELDLDAPGDELDAGASATSSARERDIEALHYLQTAVDFDFGGKPALADEYLAKAAAVIGVSKAATEKIAKEKARIDAERDPSEPPDPKKPAKPVYHKKLDEARAKLRAAQEAQESAQELASRWSEVGYQAFLDFNPSLAVEAREAVAKLGRKPGSYAHLWTKAPAAFANLKTFPRDEAETKTPRGLADFGVQDTLTMVAGELDWDAEDATACVEEALASGATTIVFEDKGSPWHVRTICPRSGQRLVFKKGVKILQDRVSRQNRDRSPMIRLKGVRNVVLEGEGGPGDVYIGKFESLAERKAGSKDYGGSGLSVESVRNCIVRNLTLGANTMDGISLSGGFEVWIENVVLKENFRQAMSVCNAGGLYCRNVAFVDTQGNAPECGIDFEPTYEIDANYDCYFYDCAFSGNAGGAVNWSSSSYYPVTAHFKRCRFGSQPAVTQINVFARCGIYMERNARAPSKIVLEDLTMESSRPTIPLRIENANLFDIEVKGLKAKNSLPVVFALGRDYSMFPYYDHAANQGHVSFADVSLEGPEGQPILEFRDKVGTYSVGNLSGTGTMNGKSHDFAAFAYAAPEKGLADVARFDAVRLRPPEKAQPSGNGTLPKGFFFIYSASWYSAPIAYRAVYFDNGWKMRMIFGGVQVQDLGLGEFPLAYFARGGDSIFKLEPRGGKPFRVYFEVPPRGTPATVKIHSGSGRLLDASGAVVRAFGRDESARYLTCAAKGDDTEVWSLEFDSPAIFKFFAPFSGLIAESPDDVPRLVL